MNKNGLYEINVEEMFIIKSTPKTEIGIPPYLIKKKIKREDRKKEIKEVLNKWKNRGKCER